MSDFGPGVEARLAAVARYVIGVLLKYDALPWNTLVGKIPERAAANRFADLRTGIGPGKPLGHDRTIHLAEGIAEQREWRLQSKADGLVRGRGDLIGARHQSRPD